VSATRNSSFDLGLSRRKVTSHFGLGGTRRRHAPRSAHLDLFGGSADDANVMRARGRYGRNAKRGNHLSCKRFSTVMHGFEPRSGYWLRCGFCNNFFRFPRLCAIHMLLRRSSSARTASIFGPRAYSASSCRSSRGRQRSSSIARQGIRHLTPHKKSVR